MKKGGIYQDPTASGRNRESKIDFSTALSKTNGYEIIDDKNIAGLTVLFKGEQVGRLFKKRQFYSFLDEKGVDWRSKISATLEPDDALLVIVRDTLFIIEIKFQNCPGSVDEKLQTCHYKKIWYQKIVRDLGLLVEYVYVLNDWFKQPRYKDVLNYITDVSCHYYFDELPLRWLGLPTDNVDVEVELYE